MYTQASFSGFGGRLMQTSEESIGSFHVEGSYVARRRWGVYEEGTLTGPARGSGHGPPSTNTILHVTLQLSQPALPPSTFHS